MGILGFWCRQGLFAPYMLLSLGSNTERRDLNPGKANSFSSLFLPKVNTTFQKCENTP